MKLTYDERQEIEKVLLAFASEQVGSAPASKYAYAFGWAFAMVSDEELAELPRRIENLKKSEAFGNR
jgi:methylthioribose-1-phosphate isomerase